MQGSNYAVEVRGSFQETALRKTAKNTVKHRDGGVGLIVANHRSGGESSVVSRVILLGKTQKNDPGDLLPMLPDLLPSTPISNQ